MRVDVFGRLVEVQWQEESWKVFYLGHDGKKRLAEDLLIPSNITEPDVVEYLSDLCHEWATVARPGVKRLD